MGAIWICPGKPDGRTSHIGAAILFFLSNRRRLRSSVRATANKSQTPRRLHQERMSLYTSTAVCGHSFADIGIHQNMAYTSSFWNLSITFSRVDFRYYRMKRHPVAVRRSSVQR